MTLKYTAEGSIETVASTQLNSLSNNSYALGVVVSNADIDLERFPMGEIEVYVAAQPGARTGGKVSLLIAPSVDGTNYPDILLGSLAAAYVHMEWTLDAAATARRLTVTDIKLPPGYFKVGLINETGYAFAGANNTVKLRRYSYVNQV